jgi:NDP-sugar pyrophosphorylase family protein
MVLICPAHRQPVAALSERQPLVLAPFLGHTVIEHALEGLAAAGTRAVHLVASEGIASLRAVLGGGERWGLSLHLSQEAGEPSPAEALARHRSRGLKDAEVLVLDRLPQGSGGLLWASYDAWFQAQIGCIAAAAAVRVGMRLVAPGAYAGLRSQISPRAVLHGPCWIGEDVCIGPGAVIGPGAILGDGCFVDEGAEVSGSLLGSGTYVGSHTEVRDSYAAGARLLSMKTGSVTVVADRFLLGEVTQAARSFGGAPGARLRRWFSGVPQIVRGLAQPWAACRD